MPNLRGFRDSSALLSHFPDITNVLMGCPNIKSFDFEEFLVYGNDGTSKALIVRRDCFDLGGETVLAIFQYSVPLPLPL